MARERAKGRCEYCTSPESIATYLFSIDHIIPLGKGGSDEPANLALSCQGCNGAKYNKTLSQDPMTGQEVPLFNPRTQDWSVHFSWSNDYLEVVGITSTGRATVEALKLNREQLKNLRQRLYRLKEHPPRL